MLKKEELLPSIKIKNYEDMGLGLFIHWGLYSLKQQGEWTELIHNLDKREYENTIKDFDAKSFDAKKIVKAAKSMGAKYIVLTAKHHEGFFLYNTQGLSSFDITHAPAKRDLIKEFVEACRDENIKPFIYMATYDWHNPDYVKNFKKYLEYLRESVKILCTNYGEISGFWFDGNWNKKNADWELDKLYNIINYYQPNAIIINNTGLKKQGKLDNRNVDVLTYERGNPSYIDHTGNGEKYVAGEISLTLNKHWGVASNDINYKSPSEIITTIAKSRCLGSNTLINIGLNGDGSIPNISSMYMNIIGKWINVYGNSIYNVRPVKTKSSKENLGLVQDNQGNLYAFINGLTNVGNDNVVLGGEGSHLKSFTNIHKPISSITWMDDNEKLKFMQDTETGALTFDASGFNYGTNWIIRVAKIRFK
ncbi:alpha-L-fucosidase [Companilactobacillus huachuanensis]|uniref:alpha-L-fucosidase n=1 Tax=Companilactobacillus huachuanensis TaxID=2559914 RepID=A0ABW1RM11_9LACO|nr:alpha-L-fucosidase [Companilactobacillus huachuanensis]